MHCSTQQIQKKTDTAMNHHGGRLSDIPTLHYSHTMPKMVVRLSDIPSLHYSHTMPKMVVRLSDVPTFHYSLAIPRFVVKLPDIPNDCPLFICNTQDSGQIILFSCVTKLFHKLFKIDKAILDHLVRQTSTATIYIIHQKRKMRGLYYKDRVYILINRLTMLQKDEVYIPVIERWEVCITKMRSIYPSNRTMGGHKLLR